MEHILQPPRRNPTGGQAKGRVGHPLELHQDVRAAVGTLWELVAIQNFPMEIKTWQDLQVPRDPSKSLLLFHDSNSSVLTLAKFYYFILMKLN